MATAAGKGTAARWFILLTASFTIIVASGVVLGWAAMLLIYNGEAEFRGMCTPSTTAAGTAAGSSASANATGTGTGTESYSADSAEDELHGIPPGTVHRCVASDLYLNMVYTVAQVAYTLSSVVLGVFVDRLGPRIACTVCLVAITAGIAMLSVSHYPTVNLVLPGFLLIASFGTPLQLCLFQVANLFPAHVSTVTSTLSGLFGVSSVVFVLFHSIWELGVSRASIFAVYAAIVGLLILFGLVLPDKPFSLGDIPQWSWRRLGFIGVHPTAASAQPARVPTDTVRIIEMMDRAGAEEHEAEPAADATTAVPISGGAPESATAPPPSSAPRLWDQVMNVEFIIFAIWIPVTFFRFAFYLGSVELQLAQRFPAVPARVIADYAQAFSWIAPFGACAAPLVGLLIDRKGIVYAMYLTCTVVAALNAVQLVPVLQIQVLAFGCYTVAQESLFACWFSFCGRFWGQTHYATLTGILFAIIAGVAAAVYPVTAAAVEHDSGFFAVNVFLFVTAVASFAVPIVFARRGHHVPGTQSPVHTSIQAAK